MEELKVFRGINAINVDEKGRLSIPTRYRQRLLDVAQGHLILTIDTEQRCLLLYSLPAWEVIEAKIEALPSFNKTTRRIQRLLLGHATEVEMDKQGRILLPPLLREYASLDGRVIMLGQGKKFELWNEETWQTQRDHWLGEELNDDSLPDELDSLAL
ncbi:MAG: cell division/cell wall cluster transcriptional repressor MraZ [Gammaproteobacteria bacterium RIFCSPHIGHO2_12_FULL_35_23]|nr:MAG: cell division/cell wall cluster transcriptional repressor MraZ [Gammaproteobacteria bacterium RIFCSPHIGHO2_12_FULL_35_23]